MARMKNVITVQVKSNDTCFTATYHDARGNLRVFGMSKSLDHYSVDIRSRLRDPEWASIRLKVLERAFEHAVRAVADGEVPDGGKIASPSVSQLVRLADIAPLRLRKKIKALAGDYQAEIDTLTQHGRFGMAKYNKVLAFTHCVVLVLRSPIDACVEIWRGKTKAE